jgi:hypothetical protein
MSGSSGVTMYNQGSAAGSAEVKAAGIYSICTDSRCCKLGRIFARATVGQAGHKILLSCPQCQPQLNLYSLAERKHVTAVTYSRVGSYAIRAWWDVLLATAASARQGLPIMSPGDQLRRWRCLACSVTRSLCYAASLQAPVTTT